MKIRSIGPLPGLLLVLSALGTPACNKAPENVQRTETTSTSPEGSVKTVNETTQVGNTVESKTETKVSGKDGVVKTKTDEYVGTVTVYTPGKKIEIMTGEKKLHGFDLEEKGLVATVGDGVTVGSRVTIVDEKGDSGVRRLSVRTGG